MPLIAFRASEKELERWKREAGEEGEKLSAWIRRKCNEAVMTDEEAVHEMLTGESPFEPPKPEQPKRPVLTADTQHTALSNWKTCECRSCTEKRESLA